MSFRVKAKVGFMLESWSISTRMQGGLYGTNFDSASIISRVGLVRGIHFPHPMSIISRIGLV